MHIKPKILINNKNIRSNILQIRDSIANNVQIWPAVKADAYGLGLRGVFKQLSDLDGFFVATLDEAIELNKLSPNCRIAILGGVSSRDECEEVVRYGFIPVLNSPEQLLLFRNSVELGYKYILHVDTGMSRLGFTIGEFMRVVADLPPGMVMLMSHLSASDDAVAPSNQLQLQEFNELSNCLKDVPKSLANSGGVFLGEEYHFDVVRPGAFIYGINSTAAGLAKPLPVVQLLAPVLQIRELERDQGVGYNGTYHARKGAVLATIGCGYADGILRSLSNIGIAYYQGYQLPYVGRVSMDYLVLDITNLPKHLHQDMKYVELIGENVTLDQIAAAAGTNGYEILTSLSHRSYREYLS